MVGSQHQRLDHCIRHAHAAHSVAFALPVLLLIRLPEAIAVGYKALAYRPPTAAVSVQKDSKMFQKIPKNSKIFSVSEKNRPPGDPLGGPKSLLEANKSLAELKIQGSKAFLVPHARI